jgi:hypothetical protein
MISSSPRAKAQADPFKSFYMHNYYDSSLVDFRTDFKKYLFTQSAKSIDLTDTIRSYDLSKVWQSGKFCSSGVLGTDYRRIDIYISSGIIRIGTFYAGNPEFVRRFVALLAGFK